MRYSALQASLLTGASRAQLEAWRAAGIAGPRYSFAELVAVRVVATLLGAGLSLARLRPAVARIAAGTDDLDRVRVVTDGEHVWACTSDAEVLGRLRDRPLAVVVTVAPFVAATSDAVAAFTAERQGFLDDLRTR